jgi:hypothetical protein
VQFDKTLKGLDELIARLGSRSGAPCDLLIEHLRAARCNLLGSMLGEYSLSLKEAIGSLACISDKGARIEMKARLQSLMA